MSAKHSRARSCSPEAPLKGTPQHQQQQLQQQQQQQHRSQRQRRSAAAAAPDSPMFPLAWGPATDAAGQQCSAQVWYQRAHAALQQRASSRLQLMEEYAALRTLDQSLQHDSAAAESSAAAGRNRYTDVLPFDYNRVVLQQHKVPYINASTISVTHPSLAQPCSYIAAQGPLPRTAADFWAMVAELQVPAVVMLTNCNEGGVVKCSQYFPAAPGAVSSAGSFEVKVVQQEAFGSDCTLRSMQLTCRGTGASHSLQHYHYHAWPDHGTPKNSSSIRRLCRALDAVRGSGRPIVVHCSAGIGRTGTFCAVDVLMQRLDAWSNSAAAAAGDACGAAAGGVVGPSQCEVEGALDVAGLVHELRSQRMGMVQTPEQYVFVYKALADDLAARINCSSSGGGGSGHADGSRSSGRGGSKAQAARAEAAGD